MTTDLLDEALDTIHFVGDYLAFLHQRMTSGMLLADEASQLGARISALASLNDSVRAAKGL